MVIGSGLLARAFCQFVNDDNVCVYASGVSNSGCTDEGEFERERKMLCESLSNIGGGVKFIYFSTCSIYDPQMRKTAYVRHKLAMEKMILECEGALICRLPQVAGKTKNVHTLLNYIYLHILDGTNFEVWTNARRNIIDVDDVARISKCLINGDKSLRSIINVANPVSYSLIEIVKAFEKVLGKAAVYSEMDQGYSYSIDIHDISPCLESTKVNFGNDYLERVISKYYG